jgi:hypothetical protein
LTIKVLPDDRALEFQNAAPTYRTNRFRRMGLIDDSGGKDGGLT